MLEPERSLSCVCCSIAHSVSISGLQSDNVRHHGGRTIEWPCEQTPQAVLPCISWFWLFAVGTDSANPNRPHHQSAYHRTSTAQLFSSAPSCSYSAQRYSYSIGRGSERTDCSQRSSLRRVTFLTVTRIRVGVRVPAFDLSTSRIGTIEANGRTSRFTGLSPKTFHCLPRRRQVRVQSLGWMERQSSTEARALFTLRKFYPTPVDCWATNRSTKESCTESRSFQHKTVTTAVRRGLHAGS